MNPKALKVLTATFFSLRGMIVCFRWRLFSSISMPGVSILFLGVIVDYASGLVFPGPAAALVNRLGIVDAMVKDAVEDTVEASGDLVEIFKRQLAFVQLAVGKDTVDDVLHHALDAVGGRVDQRP